MAEESFQEKTEQATPRRREEARRKGQVARSNELSSVAILTAGLLILLGMGTHLVDRLQALMIELFSRGFTIRLDTLNIRSHFLTWASTYLQIVAPIVLLLAFTALVVNYAQVGVLFTGEPLIPKFNRLSPLNGLKRIFSSRGLVELAKGLFKVGAVAYIAYLTISGELTSLISMMDMEVGMIFARSGGVILKLGFRIALLLLAMAMLDYAFQRWDYERNLRMTRQEVREELKQQEGDPMMRSRIRALQRDMARRRMMAEVGQADVVVTNPTHIAVALRYDPETMAAPRVVAKGQRLIAERIKEMARRFQIPLIENKPLAQALFKAVRIGDEIPEELFQAAAQVLAFVFRLRRRR